MTNWYKKAQFDNIKFTQLLGPSEEDLYYIKAVDTSKNKVVGILELSPDREGIWVAHYIRVLPEYQRQGIGTSLLQIGAKSVEGKLTFDKENATLDSGLPLLENLEEKGLAEENYIRNNNTGNKMKFCFCNFFCQWAVNDN